MSTPIPVTTPYALKTARATLQLDSDTTVHDYSDHISQVTFTPASSPNTWTGINGNTISETTASTWTCTLGLVQDLDPAGLLRFLLANDGQKATLAVVFADETEEATATVTLTAAAIGGTANGQVQVSSITIPMDGAPEFGEVLVDTDAEPAV